MSCRLRQEMELFPRSGESPIAGDEWQPRPRRWIDAESLFRFNVKSPRLRATSNNPTDRRPMKFTDGQWLLQPGVTAHYAAQAYAVEAYPDRLVVLATTRPIRHRGDTLQGPTLTLTLSSPMPGVIRVKAEHFSESDPPRL